MNKRVRSRIIKTLISIVIIIAVLAGAAVYFLAFSRQSGGGTLLPGKSISFSSDKRYLKAFISLEISAPIGTEKIKYYIKNPDNKILDQGEFDKDNNLKLDKQYPGYKGTWHIEFENLSEGKKLGYAYTFEFMNSGNKGKHTR